MMDPADLAATTAALNKAYADADERQAYYSARPGEGVPIGWDPDPDPWRPPPAGLGYSRPPRADTVFAGAEPGMVPAPLPVPMAFDAGAGPALTGSSHAWGAMPGPGAGSPGGGIVYVGTGEAPRRSLLDRILGRRH